MFKSSGSASLLVCLLFCTSASLAQSSKGFYEADGNYFSITMGIGNFLGTRPAGTMAASIPYTSMDAQGNITTHRFIASHTGLYNKAIDYYQCNYITFEVGNRTFFADYKFSGNIMHDSHVISAGKRIQIGNSLAAKVSLGLAYSSPWEFTTSSTGYDSLGSIDNADKTISILGKTFNPTFQNAKGQTEKANQLSVYYSQSNLSLIPRISFGQSDYRHFYYWDFFLEYYLPMTKTSRVDLYQNNSGTGEEVFINRHSDAVTYDGHPAGKVPAVFHGLYAGFTLGISLSAKDRFYDRQRHRNRWSRQRHTLHRRRRKSRTMPRNQKDEGKDNSRGW